MSVCLWIFVGILILILILLIAKIRLMQKSAREIREAFSDRLHTDTNLLIAISSRDRSMCELADCINEQLRLLRSQRHQFYQGDQAVKETITNISHDLRTPLTAICGYLDLLEQEEKSQEAERFLDIIKNRTDVLTLLTEELFRYSMAASVTPYAVYEKVTLNDILEESLLAHYAALQNSQITPVISMPDQKVIRLLNRQALSRIFENIIGNAIKYSSGDLQVTLSTDGNIIFSNHAPTLNEVQVQQLFHRLYTVETAERSTGLGLSIAKTLTEQMGGNIFAQYSEGMLRINLCFDPQER